MSSSPSPDLPPALPPLLRHGLNPDPEARPFARRNYERLRLYLARALRSVSRPLAYNCCYMHVPKCAGTSVTDAMRSLCPLQKRVGMVLARPSRRATALQSGRPEWNIHEDGPESAVIFGYREHLMLYFMADDAPLVCGHFLFSELAYTAFGHRYRFVSVLRNPLDRLVSNYADARLGNYIDMPFGDYLDSEVGWRHATVMLRYFSGQAVIPRSGVDAAMTAARANLEKFALVGFTDRMPAFAEGFAKVFGAKLHLHHMRPGRFEKPKIDDGARARMEQLCAGDLEFYEHARRRFAP
jgi:hypothetical protein